MKSKSKTAPKNVVRALKAIASTLPPAGKAALVLGVLSQASKRGILPQIGMQRGRRR